MFSGFLRMSPFEVVCSLPRQQIHKTQFSFAWVMRRMFKAVCKLGLEGIVSKKLDAPYKSGPKAWLKIKNPKAPAAMRIIEGGF